MDAAIGKLRRDAGLSRVIAPADARIIGIGGIGMEAMGEFGLDETNLAEIATRHHGAHVAHQRIAGVAVVDSADRARAFGGGGDVLGFRNRYRHRLFA